ncbi:putative RNA helicase SDE3 [Sesamum alatum]|uniref:RNA helicase SDE3 n=1 Tax=Sesamum alatum TaxID=300844 RepID=A0AAE2CLL7_9LAMI|nr:putative RNA helicase SDE3 [Sesamum alatum]
MNDVEKILACNRGFPYMIYGPLGTGNTMTLIEAILQIYNNKRNVRILVCAPSNSALDHILEILSEKSTNIQKNEIFRLNAYTHPFEDVNPSYIEFCCVEDSIFQCPSDSDLMQYRIIISTYTSASLLYAKGIRRGYFSYLFLDEVGQASEPETMVPLSHLYSKDTLVVLVGDPMQLRAVLYECGRTQTGTSSYGIVWTMVPMKVANSLKGRFSVRKVPKTMNAQRHSTWIISNLLKYNGVKKQTIGSLLKINGVAKVTGNLLKVSGFS